MRVIYCDLCGQPIKGIKWVLSCSNNANRIPEDRDKEICETCKSILDQIFKKRMEGILKLAVDLKTIYRLPTKKKSNNGKKKKA